MGLVDYSDSESDSDSPPATNDLTAKKPKPSTSTSTSASSSQKLIQRSATGKIIVQLPTAASASGTGTGSTGASEPSSEPPAKRARVDDGNSSSRFSGFSSFLPAPKNVGKAARDSNTNNSSNNNDNRKSGKAAAAVRIGVHLKTSAEAAFSRDADGGFSSSYGEDGDGGDDDDGLGGKTSSGGFGLNLPPPKHQQQKQQGPSIPEGQKREEDVQLVGKPLMFRPLSVARRPGQGKGKEKKKTMTTVAKVESGAGEKEKVQQIEKEKEAVPKKKKTVSLFSAGGDDDDEKGGVYGPSAQADDYSSLGNSNPLEDLDDYTDSVATLPPPSAPAPGPAHAQHQHQEPDSLSAIADSLNLTDKQRRELFGRKGNGNGNGPVAATAKVASFSMEREYAANEAMRVSGEAQKLQQLQHNPVRSIAPGKHSLKQMVNMVQSNQAALEESFAAQRTNRREAAGRYGWK